MKVTTPIAKFEIDKFENPLGKRQQDAKNALCRRRNLITNPYENLGKAGANSNVGSIKMSSTRQSMSFIRNLGNSKKVIGPSGNANMNLHDASSTAVDKPLLMAMQSQRQKLEAKRRKKEEQKHKDKLACGRRVLMNIFGDNMTNLGSSYGPDSLLSRGKEHATNAAREDTNSPADCSNLAEKQLKAVSKKNPV